MIEIVIQDLDGATIGRTEREKFLDMGDMLILTDGSEHYVLGELLVIVAATASADG